MKVGLGIGFDDYRYMKIKTQLRNFLGLRTQLDEDQLKAGTGFMSNLADTIKILEARGYAENLVPGFDHLTCRSGEIILYPRDFFIDEIFRFENSSDPDDQSILYAITCHKNKIRGLYVESYGVYHDELSTAMLERIKFCRAQRVQPQAYLGKVRNYAPETLN